MVTRPSAFKVFDFIRFRTNRFAYKSTRQVKLFEPLHSSQRKGENLL